jgi:hypothetical protein
MARFFIAFILASMTSALAGCSTEPSSPDADSAEALGSAITSASVARVDGAIELRHNTTHTDGAWAHGRVVVDPKEVAKVLPGAEIQGVEFLVGRADGSPWQSQFFPSSPDFGTSTDASGNLHFDMTFAGLGSYSSAPMPNRAAFGIRTSRGEIWLQDIGHDVPIIDVGPV